MNYSTNFYTENSVNENNKRINDIEELYQKRNRIGSTNLNNQSFSPPQYRYNNVNNYNINNHNYNNNNIEENEKNYRNQMTPNKMSFLSSIEAENNIEKYKKKIERRSDIVERNYKLFIDYQRNNRIKRINLKKSSDEQKIPNNNLLSTNNSNDNTIKILDPQYKRTYIKENDNSTQSTNRMYRSQSTSSIINNTPLVFNRDKNDPYGRYRFMKNSGKSTTDITNNKVFDKYDADKNGLLDLIKKNKEYQEENKRIIDDKIRQKESDNYNSILKEQRQIREENNYFNKIDIEDKIKQRKLKQDYKNILDEQIKTNGNSKLLNENLSYNDVIQSQFFMVKKGANIPDRKFLNKNEFVEVNPFNHRNYSLGESNLDSNTILHPGLHYQINRYLFPKIRQFSENIYCQNNGSQMNNNNNNY